MSYIDINKSPPTDNDFVFSILYKSGFVLNIRSVSHWSEILVSQTQNFKIEDKITKLIDDFVARIV
jgi:hypothetical protein